MKTPLCPELDDAAVHIVLCNHMVLTPETYFGGKQSDSSEAWMSMVEPNDCSQKTLLPVHPKFEKALQKWYRIYVTALGTVYDSTSITDRQP